MPLPSRDALLAEVLGAHQLSPLPPEGEGKPLLSLLAGRKGPVLLGLPLWEEGTPCYAPPSWAFIMVSLWVWMASAEHSAQPRTKSLLPFCRTRMAALHVAMSLPQAVPLEQSANVPLRRLNDGQRAGVQVPLGAGLHPASGHTAVLGGNRGSNAAKPQALLPTEALLPLSCPASRWGRNLPPPGHVALNLVLNAGEHQALRGRGESRGRQPGMRQHSAAHPSWAPARTVLFMSVNLWVCNMLKQTLVI